MRHTLKRMRWGENARLIGRVALLVIAVFASLGAGESKPRARREMVPPPGFERVTVDAITALCEKDDADWVRLTLTEMKPATRPSTMPSDLMISLRSQQADIIRRMKTDLALTDDKGPTQFFTDELKAKLEKLRDVNTPIFYIVTTSDRLKAIMRAGWSDPRFHYNKAADRVMFSTSVNIGSETEAADDAILPALYEPGAAIEKRQEKLQEVIRESQLGVANALSARSQLIVQASIIDYIQDNVVKPLKLRRDQEWIGLGIVGVLSCKYASQIIGQSREELMESLTEEAERNPLRAKNIDLLKPTELSDLRKTHVLLYQDAMRCKAVAVVDEWVKESGDDVIPKMLESLRKGAPADGEALVKQAEKVSGVDLTKKLRPG